MTVDSYRPPSEHGGRAPHPGVAAAPPETLTGPAAATHALRPDALGTQHAVAAGHPLAALAAHRILEAGGNAVDAGVAAGICLGVVHSDIVSFAGVAPIMVYEAPAPRGDDDLGSRRLAAGGDPRVLPRPLQGRHARRSPPDRRPGGARRLDHRARALRHPRLRGGRPAGDRARPGRLPARPVRRRDHPGQRGRLPAVAHLGADLPAGGASRRAPASASSRPTSAAPSATWPTRTAPAAAPDGSPASRPRATPSTGATSRPPSRATTQPRAGS